MTETEMRIAIAEKCGTLHEETRLALEHFKDRDGYPDAILTLGRVPNYTADLNAMHEAQGTLTPEQFGLYARIIASNEDDQIHALLHATALQRAEAFCRVFWPERFQ